MRVGLATGMRLGEVVGLCWRSVDLNQPCIHAVQQRSTYGEIKPPKGRCKKRTVFIDAATATYHRGENSLVFVRCAPVVS